MNNKAKTVADTIRREVPRPRRLPIGRPLRFDMVHVDGTDRWACPMGLHSQATCADPYGLLFGDAGEAFADWWDAQEDAEAAVEAVWGKA